MTKQARRENFSRTPLLDRGFDFKARTSQNFQISFTVCRTKLSRIYHRLLIYTRSVLLLFMFYRYYWVLGVCRPHTLAVGWWWRHVRVALAGSIAISGSLETQRVVQIRVCISLDFSRDGCGRRPSPEPRARQRNSTEVGQDDRFRQVSGLIPDKKRPATISEVCEAWPSFSRQSLRHGKDLNDEESLSSQ